MSLQKWQITGLSKNEVCYVRYSYDHEELVLGGHADCIDFIDEIIESYVHKHIPENRHSQRARIRYVIKMNKAKYRDLKKILKNEFPESFIQIKNLDRRL